MDILASLAASYTHTHPNIRLQLRKAHMRDSPARFAKKCMVGALYVAVTLGFISFLFALKFSFTLLSVPIVALLSGFLTFTFLINTPLGITQRRARETDKEVLFVGRYLLVKLESGEPLFNSLIDASRSYGSSAKYLKEIVDDIVAGKPVEEAIEYAWEYNSSEKFKRILFQILSALKTGTELGAVLKNTLRSLASEQVLEVKEYGKKLNSFMMFYLIVACILPSLGLTMFVVLSSFIQLALSPMTFLVMLFFLMVVQVMFIILIKSARPAVTL